MTTTTLEVDQPDSPALRALRSLTDDRLHRLSSNCQRQSGEARNTGDRPQAIYYATVANMADLVRLERTVSMREAVADVTEVALSLGLEL